jgi:hypothetical protein
MSSVKKTGKNKFAGYEYFELGDFIPTLHRMFDGVGLIGVVNFSKEEGTLTIINTDAPDERIVFNSPMVFASNPKGQAIQDLGSTHTYMRRYLWLMAIEVVENDSVDASAPAVNAPKAEVKVEPKVEEKVEPKAESNPEDAKLLVSKLIDHAKLAEDVPSLMDLWKSNQRQIDKLKRSDAVLFTELQKSFAELKSNLEG